MKSIKGIKATCSETKRIGSYMGDHVDVYVDRDANEAYGISLVGSDFTVSKGDVFVGTYWEPTSMAQIKSDVEASI